MRKYSIIAIGLTLVLLSQTAFQCSRRNMVSYAKDIVAGLNQALPILAGAGVATGRIQIAINIGGQLVTAFETNQDADALALTANLITAFEGVANDASLIRDPTTRTRVLAVLALVDLSLHIISNHISSQITKPMASPALLTIRRQAAKPVWRCRSSVTGKFEKMEVCKAQPDKTTVERY